MIIDRQLGFTLAHILIAEVTDYLIDFGYGLVDVVDNLLGQPLTKYGPKVSPGDYPPHVSADNELGRPVQWCSVPTTVSTWQKS